MHGGRCDDDGRIGGLFSVQGRRGTSHPGVRLQGRRWTAGAGVLGRRTFGQPGVGRAEPMLAAASNWHVLARLAGRYVPAGAALLLDIGSTTCDLIPLVDGQPAAVGRTDTQRMLAGELVYTGVERSPVCAVVGQVPYRGRTCGVAQELFATMRDVYLVLGELPEEPGDLQTADGRPATRTAGVARLARMICADDTEFGEEEAVEMAAAVAEAQADLVAAALRSRRAARLGFCRKP